MEALTRLVADSLARHGMDRPVDPRRLQWSRWFRCDSPHSLLVVPSKPGIFALAEEIAGLGTGILGGAALPRCESGPPIHSALAAEEAPIRRMLAVLQFSEDDDMAFTLDRMFIRINPMRSRLASGRCFLRFVVISDPDQRRSICATLNQWLQSSAEKASGLPADFQSSLELTDCVGTARVGRTLLSANAGSAGNSPQDQPPKAMQQLAASASHLDSGAHKNLHCPHPLPSGF
jgi:hypothetical protein